MFARSNSGVSLLGNLNIKLATASASNKVPLGQQATAESLLHCVRAAN